MEDAREYQNRDRVRIHSISQDRRIGYGEMVTVSGMTKNEVEQLRDFPTGHFWIRADEDGRLVFSPTFRTPPAPIFDEQTQPHWPRITEQNRAVQIDLISMEASQPHDSPSITIRGLCAYQYTPANYQEQAGLLESYGFECLRSRRGRDGRYIEIWYLPGLWAAEGDLALSICEGEDVKDRLKDSKEKLDRAIRFLCHHTRFGSLDACIQRACTPIPED